MSRMTVEFDPDVTRLLQELSETSHRSKTEILRRAIGLYSYLDEAHSEGNDILISDKKGEKVKQLAWF